MNFNAQWFFNLDFNQKKLLNRIVSLFPLLFLTFFIVIKIFTKNTGIYQSFFAIEDGPVEWGTTVVYLLASFVALSIGITFCKEKSLTYGVLYLIVAVGLFCIGMEEISWGQRLFELETPEFFKENNIQGELTIHNLGGKRILHTAYIIVGFYGAFAYKILPKRIKTNYKQLVSLLVPDSSLFFYFFITFIFYIYLEYISLIFYKFLGPDTIFGYGPNNFIMPKDQETIEFILALGFLFFVIINKYRQSRKRLPVGK
jgi:hypothetical protein